MTINVISRFDSLVSAVVAGRINDYTVVHILDNLEPTKSEAHLSTKSYLIRLQIQPYKYIASDGPRIRKQSKKERMKECKSYDKKG